MPFLVIPSPRELDADDIAAVQDGDILPGCGTATACDSALEAACTILDRTMPDSKACTELAKRIERIRKPARLMAGYVVVRIPSR